LLDTCKKDDCESDYPYGSTPYWLDQYTSSTDNWENAFNLARNDKMRSGWDADNRTAAEHYLFGRSMGNGDGGSTLRAAYMATGWAWATGYQGWKAVGGGSLVGGGGDASPPSMDQWQWGNAGWYDSWDPRSPFYVPKPFGSCGW
jgi:hypothetical protein